MSTELESAEPQPTVEVAPARRPSFEGSKLAPFVADLSAAYTIAQSLVKTSFVPNSYSGKPEEASAAIVTGLELGLTPMASLRSIDIIKGVPALRAVTLRALAQGAGHEIEVVESTVQKAVVRGRRKNSDVYQTITWTMDDAQRMDLINKDNWRKMPKEMLVARATSAVVRLIAADLVLAIPYTSEEVGDMGEAQLAGLQSVPAAVEVVEAPVKALRRQPSKAAAKEPVKAADAVETPKKSAQTDSEAVSAVEPTLDLPPDEKPAEANPELADWAPLDDFESKE